MTAQLALGGVVQGRPQRVPGRKRGAKPKPAPSFMPHLCVVLGIDPGATSGWAVVLRGEPTGDIGKARTAAERANAINVARECAQTAGLPLIVVAEKWSAGGWASHTTLLGLGAAWGVWRESLRECGVPESRIVRVLTQTWRARILGGTNGKGKRDWKREARAWADRTLATTHPRLVRPEGLTADESEALAIAAWGARAGEVAAVLPKRASVLASRQPTAHLPTAARLGRS